MYIAMNRFKILCGNESAFEKIWRERDSHLNKVDGFYKGSTSQIEGGKVSTENGFFFSVGDT